MFLFVADEVLSDGTQQHSTGRGVCYFKLMNKTSWQEVFLANIGCSGRCIMPGFGTETGSGSR